jgi:hypothetical protein
MNNHCTVEGLQKELSNVNALNMVYELQCVSQGFFQQCEACLRAESRSL